MLAKMEKPSISTRCVDGEIFVRCQAYFGSDYFNNIDLHKRMCEIEELVVAMERRGVDAPYGLKLLEIGRVMNSKLLQVTRDMIRSRTRSR